MFTPRTIDRMALAAVLLASTAITAATRAFSFGFTAEPAKVQLRDGTERRFYPTGPMGTTTERVDVAADGHVIARVQVLNEAVFRSIAPGMHASDVFGLIGPPASKSRFEATRTVAWEYRYRDAWGYIADFSVMFDYDGMVTGKFSAREGD
jgi:hypothetical protein